MLHRIADGPLAGSLLAGLVEDEVDEGLAGLLILLGEDLLGDVDQVAVELTLVPLGEDLVELFGGRVDGGLQDRVGLADELHVAVLDAVVDHLDVVPGPVWTHMTAAGLTLHDRGDLAENRADSIPGLLRATRHDGWTVECTLLTSGDSCTDVVKTLFLEGFFTALGVGPEAVATIDDDIALIKKGDQLLDDCVHGGAGLHHDHRLTRAGQ